jgi:hypothetical protein
MFGLGGAKLALYAGAALGLVLLGFAGGLKFDQGAVEKIRRQDAEAAAASLQAQIAHQRQVDAITARSDQEAAVHAAQATAVTIAQRKELPRHVTPSSDARCIVPFGALRVHDAAARGLSADALPIPAGKSDADASGLALSGLLDSVTANYGTCRQARQTLIDLQGWVRSQQAAAPSPPQ